MDEVEMVRRLLAERPPPAAMAARVERRLAQSFAADDCRASGPLSEQAPALRLNSGGPALGGRPPGRRRRWRGWLAPVAAAAAVLAAVAGALTISGAIGRHHGAPRTSGDAAAAVARAGVPRYFVDLPLSIQGIGAPRAVVGVTATGAVLGTVTTPKPYSVFSWASADANARVFVLAALRQMPGGHRQSRFYRLVLSRSGRPGPLTPLPIPALTGSINGFALSPDGSKLAVSFDLNAPGNPGPSTIKVFRLATGAARTWVWSGAGFVGWHKPLAQSLSWESDNRTLLFEQHNYISHGRQGRVTGTSSVRLLDTATSGGTLEAASKRLPFPSQPLTGFTNGLYISGPPLITGDGTKVVAPTTTMVSRGTTMLTLKTAEYLDLHRQCGAAIDGFTKQNGRYTAVDYIHYRETPTCMRLIQQRDRYFRRYIAPRADHLTPQTKDMTITEFSVKTGRPVLILDRQTFPGDGEPTVEWAGASGTSLIADVPGPLGTGQIGVQDGATFTPLPAAVQHAFQTGQLAW
jgi:hypothetical protein